MVRNTSTIQDTNGWCWKFRNNKKDSSILIRNQFHKEVEKITSSFYIMNFSDYVDAKRLWVECQSYGRIVNAFIANKRSKAGKRFGFVRFLGVKYEEQLARSLASIWISSYHLFAYVACFNRQKKNKAFSKNNRDKTTNFIPSQKADDVGSSQNKKSYASSLNGDRDSKVEKQVTAVKGNSLSNVPLTPSLITPALVLDDSCTSIFVDHKESEYISDDESLHGAKNKSVGSQHREYDLVDYSDVEGVFETFFGDKHPSPNNSVCNCSEKENNHIGVDLNTEIDKVNSPLVHTKVMNNLQENVLNKKPKGVAQDSDSSLSHPPGFTPEVSRQENNHIGVDLNTEIDKVNSPLVHTKVMNNLQEVHENVTSNGESAFNYSHNSHNGVSILEVLDDMILVGQSMGYAIEGCMKDIEHIIRTQGVDVVPK
nr:RNA-directed DNA polymerase, eukaryota, reverse transcriptase zinc-binding domain protein [Tanacetum cinerariifolium]